MADRRSEERSKAAHEEKRLLKQSSRTLAKHVLSLLDDSEFSDLLLSCGKSQWSLHSILILARTPRLHSVLLSRFQSSPIPQQKQSLHVHLPAQVSQSFDIDLFLRCLYSGQDVNAEQSQLLDLLRLFPNIDMALSEPLYANLPESGSPGEPSVESTLKPHHEELLIELNEQKTEPELISLLEQKCQPPLVDIGDAVASDSTLPVDELIAPIGADNIDPPSSQKINQTVKPSASHTMSDVSEFTDEILVTNESAQDIVERMLRQGGELEQSDLCSSGDLLEKLAAIEREEQPWRLDEEQQHTLSSSMVRSSTFDLLAQGRQDSGSGCSEDPLIRPTANSTCSNIEFERRLYELDNEQSLPRSAGKPSRCSARRTGRRTTTGQTSSSSESEQCVRNSRQSKTTASSLERSGRGFMFISMEQPYEQELNNLASPYDDYNDSRVQELGRGTFERRNRRRQVEQPSVCDECGCVNCECDQRLQNSLLSCSKLGEDLLWLFLFQTDCDMRLLVDEGRRWLGAHRCILAARSEYLRTQLTPTELESTSGSSCSNEPQTFKCVFEFSFAAVHFALCHIYSGTLALPNFASRDPNAGTIVASASSASLPTSVQPTSLPYQAVPLAELLHLCELLQLPHLAHAIVAAVRTHLCHQFHSPCARCMPGVCQALKLAERAELPALRQSCIRWLARYFPVVVVERPLEELVSPSAGRGQAFSTRLVEQLLQTIGERLDESNVLAFAVRCELATDALVRAGRSVEVRQLLSSAIACCAQYMANRLHKILRAGALEQILSTHGWQVEPLQRVLDACIECIQCDEACQALAVADDLIITYERAEERHVQLLRHIRRRLEQLLIRRANEAVYCAGWACLSGGVQRHIKQAAVLVFEFEKPLAKRPQLSSSMRKSTKNKNNSEIESKAPNSRRRSKQSQEDAYENVSFFDEQDTINANDVCCTQATDSDKMLENVQDDDDHIYDEVPLDELRDATHQPLRPPHKNRSQVAKVSPFTRKGNVSPLEAVYENVREIGNSSSRKKDVGQFLQEAQFLTRRLSSRISDSSVLSKASGSSPNASAVATAGSRTSASRSAATSTRATKNSSTRASTAKGGSLNRRPPFK